MLTPKDYDKMLQFILKIQEDEDTFRQTVLSQLNEIYGFSHMTFFLADKTGHLANPILADISSDSLVEYSNYYNHVDIFNTSNIPKPLLSKKVVSVTDMMTYEQFLNTEYYNDFLKKMNLYYEIVLPFTANNNLLGMIGIFKPKEAGSFTDKEVNILSNLNKHVAHNLKTHLDITQIKYEQYIFKNCSLQSPVGLIVLDYKLAPVYYNNLAKDLCLDISGSKSIQDALSQVVDTLVIKILKQSFNSEVTIKDYIFKIIPLIIPSLSGSIESVYVIYINKPAKQEKPPIDKIAASYCLTVREKEILALIYQGLNNNEVADRLFISIHTAKSHVESIYKKMNVTKRTAIFNLINEFNE